MSRFVIAAAAVLLLLTMSLTQVKGATFRENAERYNAGALYDELPEEQKNALGSLGVNGIDPDELGSLSFDKILSSLGSSAVDNMAAPLRTLAAMLAVMLLYSLLYGLRTTAESSMSGALSLCTTLCVSCIAVVPMISMIDSSSAVIKTMADFMQSFVPIIAVVIAASGHPAGGTAYYGFTIAASQIAVRVFSDFIVPFLRILLAVSITSAVSTGVNLGGIIRSVSKFSKWILGFIMTLFTAMLSFRQILASGTDKLSDRAVRFALSGSVPIVGSALAEAYKTVQGSLDVLKSGIGVFAVIAVACVAAPALISCLCWMFSLWAAKSAGELMGLKEPCALLESVEAVAGMFFAVMLSCACMFVISAALVLTIGGGG